MSETFITIISVMLVAILFFVVPFMATASQNDNITNGAVQALLSEFVNTAAKEGKITVDNYDKLMQKLYATGNSYELELEAQKIDDNPGKKGERINVIGENIYYSVFTKDILSDLEGKEKYLLNQGDYIIAKVHNNNVTIGTQLKNFAYKIVGKDTIAIDASASALVAVTGK